MIMINTRFREFLDSARPQGPCLLIDLEAVQANYEAFGDALPFARVFYAVKANPAREIIDLLAGLGACFDCASIWEVEQILAAGVTPDRLSFGNTIKKIQDVERAYGMGVRLFAVDCEAEVDKIASAAPGSRVFCRILCRGDGASWPLSRKFGCEKEMAVRVMEHAHARGLDVYGLSFHVGSQQCDPHAWDRALEVSENIFSELKGKGIHLRMVNLGGGFPAHCLGGVPERSAYGQAILASLRKYFGDKIPEIIIEPGRGIVADAGVIKAEVVLISKKHEQDAMRWVYLDIGKFGGLAETTDEAIRYPIRTVRDDGEKAPVILAGPTCDSIDILYEKTPCMLPLALEIGDEVLIEGTGAYTMTYAANHFNGIPPLNYFVV